MFKSPLFWKIVTLGGAILLLLIPLTMVRQIIVERSDYRDEVEDAIRQSTSGPQKMVGPLIAVPVTELYIELEGDKQIQRKRSYIHFWLPESLVVEGSQNVEARKIGIYEGQEAYVFKFPEDSCTGYPFVYLYDGKDATEITGPLSLDVIDSCIENIEEGDIE